MNELLLWLQNFIGITSTSPAIIFLLIIAATFILEDAATIGAALLSADAMIAPGIALSALFVGIILGDLGLYGVGRYGATHSKLKKWIEGKHGKMIASWAKNRTWSVVFTSRFIPGLRLPTYVSAGLFKAPFVQFTFAVVVATAIWTIALFTLVYNLGAHILNELGPAKWGVAIILIATVIMVERFFARRRAVTSAYAGSGK